MSTVWDMILQWGSTVKVSIELPVATRHHRDMTEKLLKATLNPNTHTHILILWSVNYPMKLKLIIHLMLSILHSVVQIINDNHKIICNQVLKDGPPSAVRIESDCESRGRWFKPRSSHILSWRKLSWNNFYGHCCQIQEGQMSVSGEGMCTQYWLTRLERLSLPRNSVVRLTDDRYMTEILLLWRKTPTQTKKQVLKVWNDCKNINACESLWIYCTTVIFLSFRTDRSGQTVQTQIRLLLEEQSLIRVYTVCHSVCIVWTHYSMVEPHISNFRLIKTNFLVVRIFRKFTVWLISGI